MLWNAQEQADAGRTDLNKKGYFIRGNMAVVAAELAGPAKAAMQSKSIFRRT